MSAKVYLVGAGPGDTELLTRKAWRVLQSADVILHWTTSCRRKSLRVLPLGSADQCGTWKALAASERNFSI